MQLNLQRLEIDRAHSADVRLQSENRELGARIRSLELTCAGLWSLLKTRLELSDEELSAAIHHVDTVDRNPVFAAGHEPATCSSCGKKALSQTATKCLWCGAPMDHVPFDVR